MKKGGFTLIELVIVIVILGILAAVAVPKFAGLTKDAKISAVQGFAGSLRAAANIVHAKWLVSDNGSNTVNVEGTDVTVDNKTCTTCVPGYPIADNASGIVDAVNFDNKTFTPIKNSDNVTFEYKNNPNCSVTYKYATSSSTTTSSAPTVTIDTTGCK